MFSLDQIAQSAVVIANTAGAAFTIGWLVFPRAHEKPTVDEAGDAESQLGHPAGLDLAA